MIGWIELCREIEKLASILDALAHPIRLRIVALLWRHGEMYLTQLSSMLGISRALAKVHLKKLEQAGIVESIIEVEEEKAVAHRYYKLSWRDEIKVSPELIAELIENCEEKGGGDS